MNYRDIAEGVLLAVGGAHNITAVSTCLTRLRLTLSNASAADMDSLRAQRGVLGVNSRGADRLEVVFGPTAIEGVAREFAIQSGCELDNASGVCKTPLAATLTSVSPTAADDDEDVLSSLKTGTSLSIPAGRKRSYRAQQRAAIEEERLSKDDIDALRAFLSDDEGPSEVATLRLSGSAPAVLGRSVLVINGPNINMLGMREPDIYGRQDYAALLNLCKDAARKAGFADIKCFQSNHEGAIVDEIQAALGSFDGIVINPAAYTHTSVAILDAVKATGLPCVEVHISKVEEREDFRQVSYIRQACFETITGMGLEGYRKAINDLAEHLGM